MNLLFQIVESNFNICYGVLDVLNDGGSAHESKGRSLANARSKVRVCRGRGRERRRCKGRRVAAPP